MTLTRKVSISIMSQGFASFLVMVTSVILARYLSKKDYGTFQQVQILASTMLMIGVLGLPNSLYYYMPKAKDIGGLVKRTVLACFVMSLFVGLGFLFLENKVASWMNNPDIARLSYLCFLLLLSMINITLFEAVFISIDESDRYYYLTALSSVMMFMGVVVPVILSKGIEWMLICLILQNVISSSILLWMFRNALKQKHIKASLGRETVSLREQFIYSLPLALAFVIGTIGKQIDRFIISIYFTPADYAIYSRGAIDIPLIPIVVYSFSTMLMPRYVALYDKGEKHEMVDLWKQYIVYAVAVNFPAFILLYYLADDIIIFLYSASYENSAQVLRGFLFLLLIQVTSFGGILRVIGKTRIITYMSLLSLATNIILGVTLVPRYGVLGPVIATVISSGVVMAYCLYQLRKKLEIPFGQLWPWKKTAYIMLISLISCCVFSVNLLFPVLNRVVKILMSSVIFGICYLGLIYITNVIPKTRFQERLGKYWA